MENIDEMVRVKILLVEHAAQERIDEITSVKFQ